MARLGESRYSSPTRDGSSMDFLTRCERPIRELLPRPEMVAPITIQTIECRVCEVLRDKVITVTDECVRLRSMVQQPFQQFDKKQLHNQSTSTDTTPTIDKGVQCTCQDAQSSESAELEQLTRQITTLQSALQSAEQKNTHLQGRVEVFSKSDATGRVAELESQLSSERQKIIDREHDAKIASLRDAQREERVKSLEEKFSTEVEQHLETKSDLDRALGENRKMQAQGKLSLSTITTQSEEINQLTKALDEANTIRKELQEKIRARGDCEPEMSRLRTQVDSLTSTNSELQTIVTSTSTQKQTIPSLQSEIRKLQDANKSLQSQVASLETTKETLTEKEATIQEQTMLITRLKKTQEEQRTHITTVEQQLLQYSENEVKVKRQMTTISMLEGDLETQGGYIAEMEREIRDGKKRLADLQRLTERVAELDEVELNYGHLTKKHADTENSLKRSQQQLKTLEAELADVTAQLDALHSTENLYKKLLSKFNALERQHTALQNSHTDQDTELLEQNNKLSALQGAQLKLNSAQLENDRLREEVKDQQMIQQQLSQLEFEHKRCAEKSNLSALELTKQKELVKQLQQQLENAETAQTESEDMAGTLKRSEQKVLALTTTISSLKENMKTQDELSDIIKQKEEAIQDEERKCDDLRKQVGHLQEQLASMQNREAASSSVTQKELIEKNNLLAQKEEQLKGLNLELEARGTRDTESQKELVALRLHFSQTEHLVAEHEKTCAQLFEKNSEIATLTASIKSLERQLETEGALRSTNDTLQTNNQQLESDLQTALAKASAIPNLQKQLSQLQEKLYSQSSELTQAEVLTAELKQSLVDKERQVRSSEDRIGILKESMRKASEAQDEHSKLLVANDQQALQITKLEATVSENDRQLSRQKESMSNLQEFNDQLKAENATNSLKLIQLGQLLDQEKEISAHLQKSIDTAKQLEETYKHEQGLTGKLRTQYEADLTKRDRDIETLEVTNKHLELQIADSISLGSKKDERLEELEKLLHIKQEEITDLKSQIIISPDEVATLRTTLATLQDDYAKATDQLYSLQNQDQTELESRVSDLRSELETREATAAAKIEEFTVLKREVEKQKEEVEFIIFTRAELVSDIMDLRKGILTTAVEFGKKFTKAPVFKKALSVGLATGYVRVPTAFTSQGVTATQNNVSVCKNKIDFIVGKYLTSCEKMHHGASPQHFGEQFGEDNALLFDKIGVVKKEPPPYRQQPKDTPPKEMSKDSSRSMSPDISRRLVALQHPLEDDPHPQPPVRKPSISLARSASAQPQKKGGLSFISSVAL